MKIADQKPRRRWLRHTAGLTGLGLLGPGRGVAQTSKVGANSNTLSLTPSCDGSATAAQMEGPYYTPKTPRRANLLSKPEPGATPLRLLFKVVDQQCQAVPGALVDLWCCDGKGDYDNKGMHLRGHQLTNDQGLCNFDLIQPGAYGNAWFRRTPHLHVKVSSPNGKLLTTQLYFPAHPLNEQDGLFDPSLLLSLDGSNGQFVFVV